MAPRFLVPTPPPDAVDAALPGRPRWFRDLARAILERHAASPAGLPQPTATPAIVPPPGTAG